jgi:hypothetical protein
LWDPILKKSNTKKVYKSGSSGTEIV